MNQEKITMIVCAKINPNEALTFKSYVKSSGAIFAAAGGNPIQKYLVETQMLGDSPIDVVSIMTFPNQEILDNVFESDAYKAILPLRDKAFLKLNVYISK